MTERGHDRGGPGSDGGSGQTLFAVGAEPHAAVHRVGLNGKVESSDVTRFKPEDEWSRTGDRLQCFGDSESVPDLIRHDVERKLCRALEDQQLEILPGIGVDVVGVDCGLLHTADHQYGRA